MLAPDSLVHPAMQIYTAKVRPGQPFGLDLSWTLTDPGMASASMDGRDVTHLLPAVLPKSMETATSAHHVNPPTTPAESDQDSVEADRWCGQLEVFDTECKVCMEWQKIALHTTALPRVDSSGPRDMYLWRMNTWACMVGDASAPSMPPPSDYHLRHTAEGHELDALPATQDQARRSDARIGGSRRLLQVEERYNADRGKYPVHLLEEVDGEGPAYPPNNAAWLLYTAPTQVDGNYTQSGLAGSNEDCWMPLAPLADTPVSSEGHAS